MARELTPAATLGAYGAGLALVFTAALGVGNAVGPVGSDAPEHGRSHSTDMSGSHTDGSGTHTSSTDGEPR